MILYNLKLGFRKREALDSQFETRGSGAMRALSFLMNLFEGVDSRGILY